MAKKEKPEFIVIDNSNNYFNLNEVVTQFGKLNKDKKRLYKSKERNFEAFISDLQVTPRK